jgi:multiple sugar transport system permease protein
MSYLESLPRRLVTLYLPLVLIMLVLLFPFYWMALTAIKPDEQLLDLERFNPFWTWTPTLKHIQKLLFETTIRCGCGTRCWSRSPRPSLDRRQRARRLRDSCGCATRARRGSGSRSSSPISFRPRSCSFRSRPWCSSTGLFDTPFALILTYPDDSDPVLDLAA